MVKWSPKFHQRTPTDNKQVQQSGYKINSKKSVAFLLSKDKQTEKEIREMTPFTIVTNNIKYIGVTLTKQVKDLCVKNLKYTEKIEEDFRKWKDLPCL